MQTFILMILALLIFFFIESNIKKEQLDTFDAHNLLDVDTDFRVLDIIRKMLNDVDSSFKKYGIRYWMEGHTLFGIAKHKNILPWENSASICVLSQDKERFLDLEGVLGEMGYGVSQFWGGFKVYPLNGIDIKHYNKIWIGRNDGTTDISDREYFDYKLPFLDIFFCHVNPANPNRIEYSNPNIKKVWPGLYWETKNVIPLKRYKLNGFSLYGPKNPGPHLTKMFGKNWKTISYEGYHKQNMRRHPVTRAETRPMYD